VRAEEFPHSVLDWFMVSTSAQMLDAASESPKGINVGSRRRQPTESEGIPHLPSSALKGPHNNLSDQEPPLGFLGCAILSGLFSSLFACRDPQVSPAATHIAPLQGASMPGLWSAPIPVFAVRNQSHIADKPAILRSGLGKLL